MSERIAFYCSGIYLAKRVSRLQPPLLARGWSAVIVTPRLGIWLYAKLSGIPVLLMRPGSAALPGSSDPAIHSAFGRSAWDCLETALDAFGIKAIASWGTGPFDAVAHAFAVRCGLAELHFELGNVEPKTLLDPDGVNARARVARQPALLDRYNVSDSEIEAWKQDFVERKQRQTGIPQQPKWWALNPWFALDLVGILLLRIPQQQPLDIVSKLRAKYALLRRRFDAPVMSVVPTTPYVFLPLQVSVDSNLRLFATVDNFDAIRIAAARARELRCSLVIKPHPAEPDASLLASVRTICEEAGHVLTNANTAALVLGAAEVVTINSSVGLEARLMGKPVTCLGQSVYAGFTDRQAAVFVMRHLIPFAPFGSEAASVEVADRIIELIRASGRES